MSSPLRKRMRSPGFRPALSAGLPAEWEQKQGRGGKERDRQTLREKEKNLSVSWLNSDQALNHVLIHGDMQRGQGHEPLPFWPPWLSAPLLWYKIMCYYDNNGYFSLCPLVIRIAGVLLLTNHILETQKREVLQHAFKTNQLRQCGRQFPEIKKRKKNTDNIINTNQENEK